MNKHPQDDATQDGAGRGESERNDSFVAWRKYRPVAIVGVLLVVLTMLPSIAAQTPLLSWGVTQAAAGIQGKVSVGSASLGWFSPIVLRDVKVTDTEGQLLAEIPTVRISKSLLGVLANSNDLGTIELTQPTAHVVVLEGSSNIEQLFPVATPLPSSGNGEAAPSSAPVATQPRTMRLVLRNGTVHLADGRSSRGWKIEDVSADVDWRDPSGPAPCTFSANVHDRQLMGVVQGKGTLPGATGDTQFSLVTKGMPLGIAELIGIRLGQPCVTQGQLNGQIDLISTTGSPSVRCNLEAVGVDVRMLDSARGTGWNNGTLRASGELTWTSGRLVARQFSVTTDWGQVLADGNIPAAIASAQSPNGAAGNLLGSEPWELRGTVDLARLAGAFPQLLKIREDAQLEQGRATVTLANSMDSGAPIVNGSAVISGISAVVGGRHADWQQPLEATFALSMPQEELQLDRFTCRSAFLSAEGKTDGPTTDVQFELDGNRFMADLSQLIDLQGNQLAGMFHGSLQIENLGQGRLAVAAIANGSEVQWYQGTQRLLAEPNMQTQIHTTLDYHEGAVHRIETASAQIKTQQTAFTVQTASDVTLGPETVWPIKLQLQGPIDPVWAQLKYAAGLGEYHVGGYGQILAKLTLNNQRWDLEGINLDVNDFALVGPLTQIHEKKLNIEGSARLDWEAKHLSAPQLVVIGTTVSARATDLAIPLGSGGMASGKLAYRVDLNRGVHWVVPPEWLGKGEVAGEMSGTMTLAKSEQGFVLQNSGQIANWELRVPGPPMGRTQVVQIQPASTGGQTIRWQEPNLSFAQSISLNQQEDSLAVHACEIKSSALKVSVAGGVSELSADGNLSLSGQADYDWGKLSPLLSALVGPDVSVAGKRSSRLEWSGPIWPAETSSDTATFLSPTWNASGELSWEQANLYGIPTKETTMNAVLRQGVVQLSANSPEISGGQLALQTQLLLNAQPMQWQLARGRMIDNVAITPPMCQSWLRYVAPILADATRVEGRFSLDLQGGRLPLAGPMQGEASGVLHIHGAEVRSGPLAQGYVDLGRNIEGLLKGKPISAIDQGSASLITLPPQEVSFRLVQGRVYHENLVVQSGEVRMVTSGWVDANQQMQLMVSIPIQDQWTQKAPWLAALRGTALTVPIGGTMQNPRIDAQVIENLARNMINSATQGAIQEGINRGLQELFRPR